MKKAILLLFAVFAFVITRGQTYTKSLISANTHALINTVDTIKGDSSLKYMTLATGLSPTLPKGSVTISAIAKLISGTGAGTVILQGSVNGISYATIPTNLLLGGQVATFTLTNVATQIYHFVVLNNQFSFYRIAIQGVSAEYISIAGSILSSLSN